MGWRDFQFNKATLVDKVYKEDKETSKQVTLSALSSLSLIESPINQDKETEKGITQDCFFRSLDKEDKVKSLNLPAINEINNHNAGTTADALPANSQLTSLQTRAKKAPGINMEPAIKHYSAQPPAEALAWMMQSVMEAPECDQLHWFAGLEQWRDNFHDKDWADEVIKRLVHCQIEEPQPVQSTRKDFELAKQMFGGRVISQATCGVITQ